MEKIDFKKQQIPFTQVANAVLNDPNISFKAKGLYSYIYSKPDGWDFALDRIAKDTSDGRRATYTGILELEEAGYLKREKVGSGEDRGRTRYRLLHEIDSRPQKPVDGFSKEAKQQRGIIDSISNKESKVIKSISNKDLATKVAGNEILTKDWNLLIDGFKGINPLWEDFYSNKTERKALQDLASKIGLQKLIRTIAALPELTSQPYAPKITKPTELKRNLGKLVMFVKQNKRKVNKYQVTNIH